MDDSVIDVILRSSAAPVRKFKREFLFILGLFSQLSGIY